MRLLFAGTPAVALPSLQALIDSHHEVVAVLTRPDAPVGRGRELAASPVKTMALEAGIEVLTPAKVSDPQFLEVLKGLHVDCAPIVAYGGLIPAPALAVPRYGWVNLHFSLLPAWRGAAPVQRAVLAGDDITGATTFQLDEGLDTGPVFGMITEPIKDDDTSEDLLHRLSISGAHLLLQTLNGIESQSIVATPQPLDGISVAPKLSTSDAFINFRHPALALHRQIRACTPAPGAWSTIGQNRIKLLPTQMRADVTDLAAGHVRVTKTCVLVGTGSHALQLGLVQPSGKKVMPATDWARGIRLQDGPLFL